MESSINERINNVISTLNITKNAFADKLGVAGSVVYNIANGRNKPSYDLLEKIVSLFDIRSEYLLTGNGDVFSSKNNISMQGDFVGAMQGNIENFNTSNFPDNDILDEIRETSNLLLRLEKANKLNVFTDSYTDIQGDIDMINSYLGNYNVMQNIIDTLNEYRKKKIEWNDVMTEFKKRLDKTIELYRIMIPYKDVINEIYEKVSDFNDRNDRLYCLDDEEGK